MANVYSNTDTAQFFFIYPVTGVKQNHVTLKTNCILRGDVHQQRLTLFFCQVAATLTCNITVTGSTGSIPIQTEPHVTVSMTVTQSATE